MKIKTHEEYQAARERLKSYDPGLDRNQSISHQVFCRDLGSSDETDEYEAVLEYEQRIDQRRRLCDVIRRAIVVNSGPTKAMDFEMDKYGMGLLVRQIEAIYCGE